MNILMISGPGELTNKLIRKLKKEGHRVYLLTNGRYHRVPYEKVFERYDLTYDSACLSDVFKSASPDVTVFMGAFDSNFRWQNEEREMVRFASSLTNFLTAYTITGTGRFVYLSSDEVYSNNYAADITEQTPKSPDGMKGMAIAQGEDICDSFRKNTKADIVTARLDHHYHIPTDAQDINDICAGMCLEAMQTGRVRVGQNRFSLLYESDAVEFIYKLIQCGSHNESIYNLSSSAEVTQKQIAEYIAMAMRKKATIEILEEQTQNHRCLLSNSRFAGEFGAKIFADTEKTVGEVVKYMLAHEKLFLTGQQEKKSFWKRLGEKTGWLIKALFPYLENLVCFFLVFLLSASTVKSQFFQRLDLYLLYVLLFAVIYGQQQATFSAIFAMLGYFYTQARGQGILSVMLDYNVYIWIAQLFIVGLVVGYMKDQIQKLHLESEEERHFLDRQLSDIKDINGSNIRVKDALETQLVNHSDSVGKIYSIVSQLEKYTPEEVLFHAAQLLEEILGSQDIAIYTISDSNYARLFAFTSEKAKTLGKSMRYQELGELYSTVAAEKVYINRELDDRYPLMATAVFDDSDHIQLLLMAWGVPWERMTLGQADLMAVVSALIRSAVLRAARYIVMLENQRYQEGKLVMETEAFTSLTRVFLEARAMHLTECVMLRVAVPTNKRFFRQQKTARRENQSQADAKNRSFPDFRAPWKSGRSDANPVQKGSYSQYEEMAKILSGKVRNTDYIGTLADQRLYILLTNTNAEEADFVIRRLAGDGCHAAVAEDIVL